MIGFKILKYLIVVLVCLLFAIPSLPSEALTVDLTTTIPEWILDDNITLNGTYEGSKRTIDDDTTAEFVLGTAKNASIEGNRVILKTQISFSLLNNGKAVLTQGGSGKWDVTLRFGSSIKVNSTYYIFYSGGASWQSTKIGLATSTDGVSFTKSSSNPILSPQSGESAYAKPYVYHDGSKFYMYYSVWDGFGFHLNLATSTDATNWTRYANNPIMNHGGSSSWNYVLLVGSIFRDGNQYRMYYYSYAQGGTMWLATAMSKDLKSWTQYANNPLRRPDTSGWEDFRTTYGSIENGSGSYRLWATSGDTGTTNWYMGWMYSDDAISFTPTDTAVLSPKAGTIYSHGVRDPYVFDEGDHYLMLCMCFDNNMVATYGAFKVSKSKYDGNYTSKVFDARGEVELTAMSWKKNVTSGASVALWFRWSNDSANWTSWYPLDRSPRPLGITARYFQYRAEFNTSWDWVTPSLERFLFTYFAPCTSIQVSVAGAPLQNITYSDGAWGVNVDLEDGDYDITLKAWDSTGYSRTIDIPVKVDLFPPTGNITLADGKSAINRTDIDFELQANDTHEVTNYRISTLPDLSDASWQPFSGSGTFSYGGPDGNIKVYVAFLDETGRISQIVNDTITVDTTPFTAKLVINGGDDFTNRTKVNLTVDWTDLTEIVSMKVSTTPDVGIWGNTVEPSNDLRFEMGRGEGVRTVYVWLMDEAGWTTVVTDTIILDTLPPLVSVLIDEDELYTNSRAVTLEIDAYDEATIDIMIRNKGDPWPSRWQTMTYPGLFEWTLVAGDDGSREVLVRVRDAARNIALSSDVIVLDTTPPRGELLIDAGASYTGDTLVRCGLIAEDDTSGVFGMRVGNSPDLTGISLEPITSEFDWTLPAGDGPKTIYIEIVDRAGLTTTISATITLDVTNPEGYILINDGAEYTKDDTVTISFTVTDALSGVDVYRISEDSFFGDETWEPFSTTVSWSMSPGDGKRDLFAQVRDVIGNVVILTDSIILDTTAPIIIFNSPLNIKTESESVTIDLNITDAIDDDVTTQYRIDNGTWKDIPSQVFKVKVGEGKHVIEIRAVDDAGNEALGTVEVDYSPTFQLSSASLLIIIIIIVVVGFVGYYMWNKRTSES